MGSIYFADSASGTGEYVGQLNYDHTTDSMQFGVNVGEKMRITSSGQLLLGTTIGTSKLSIAGTANNTNSEILITATSVASGYIGANSNGLNLGTDTAGIVFKTGVTGGGSVGATGTERMRIKSTGNVLVGTNTDWFSRRFVAEYTDSAAAFINSNVNSPPISVVNTASSGTNVFVVFYTDSRSSPQSRGSIDYNRSAGQVRYNVTSDKRLKSNIQPAQSATDLLSSIQVRSYEWTETGHQIAHGFIAQELNEIMPDAVKVGDSDEQVSDAWSVDHSKMVPMLTKALQEAIAKIETLEAKVASLEG